MTNPVQVDDLDRFCRAVLAGVGADPETARDCTASMIHGSIHGVDSHGVRLLGHYTVLSKENGLRRAGRFRSFVG